MKTRVRTTKSASMSTSATETATVAPTPIVASPPAAPAPAVASVAFLELPPASANIPSSPKGWVDTSTADYRNLLPRKTELAALPGAIKDLGRFTSYAQTLGAAAPPIEHLIQSMTSAGAWSSMRTVTSAWDGFSAAQEGIGWTMLRSQMDLVKPVFELAASSDPQLAVQFPSLAAFLGAKKAIAQRAASTKKANAKQIAEGKEPTHGAVGKRRVRAAEKAALAASGSPPVSPVAPVTAPVAASVAPTAEAPNGASAGTPAHS